MIASSYPESPGWKTEEVETSRRAAEQVAAKAKLISDRVLAAYDADTRGLTAEECAHKIGEPRENVAPRITELKLAGLLEKTALRRKNASGATATVWRRVPPKPQQQDLPW